MTGLSHHKVKVYYIYDKLGVLRLVVDKAITKMKTEMPLSNIIKKGIYYTRNKKYKKYEGYFKICPQEMKFKQTLS